MASYRLVFVELSSREDIQKSCDDLGVFWNPREQALARHYDLSQAKRLQQAFSRRGITLDIIEVQTATVVAVQSRLLSSYWLMRINIFLCTALFVLLGGYFFLAPIMFVPQLGFGGRAVLQDTQVIDGALAPYPPSQTMLATPEVWELVVEDKGYRVEAVAEYVLEARLLSKKRYRYDRNAAVAPWDMVLGWQEMSDNRWLQYVTIQQQRRWYYWRANDPTVENTDIALRSANVHMVPANDVVRQTLVDIHPHQLIRFEGFLVNIYDDINQSTWKTSLRRDDEGFGACEVFWVTDVRILPDRYFLER